MSAIASSMVANGVLVWLMRRPEWRPGPPPGRVAPPPTWRACPPGSWWVAPAPRRPSRTGCSCGSCGVRSGGRRPAVGDELLDVLGQYVDLEVDGRPRHGGAQRGALERLGDERHGERRRVDRGHRERHAVDGDRALLD